METTFDLTTVGVIVVLVAALWVPVSFVWLLILRKKLHRAIPPNWEKLPTIKELKRTEKGVREGRIREENLDKMIKRIQSVFYEEDK